MHFTRRRRRRKEDLNIRQYSNIIAGEDKRQRGKGLAVGNNTRIITEDEVECKLRRKELKRKKLNRKKKKKTNPPLYCTELFLFPAIQADAHTLSSLFKRFLKNVFPLFVCLLLYRFHRERERERTINIQSSAYSFKKKKKNWQNALLGLILLVGHQNFQRRAKMFFGCFFFFSVGSHF